MSRLTSNSAALSVVLFWDELLVLEVNEWNLHQLFESDEKQLQPKPSYEDVDQHSWNIEGHPSGEIHSFSVWKLTENSSYVIDQLN